MRGRFLVISSTSLELALIPPQDEMNLWAGRCRSCTSAGRTVSLQHARPAAIPLARQGREERAAPEGNARAIASRPAREQQLRPAPPPPLHTPPPAGGARGRCGTGRARLGEVRAWPPSSSGRAGPPFTPRSAETVSRCPSPQMAT